MDKQEKSFLNALLNEKKSELNNVLKFCEKYEKGNWKLPYYSREETKIKLEQRKKELLESIEDLENSLENLEKGITQNEN